MEYVGECCWAQSECRLGERWDFVIILHAAYLVVCGSQTHHSPLPYIRASKMSSHSSSFDVLSLLMLKILCGKHLVTTATAPIGRFLYAHLKVFLCRDYVTMFGLFSCAQHLSERLAKVTQALLFSQ